MFQKKEKDSRKRFFRFLSDYLLFSALCLFLVSTINPFITSNYFFLHILDVPIFQNPTVTYWSYKASSTAIGDWSQIYFNRYWFSKATPVVTDFPVVSWMLVTMFSLQILTMIFALVSLVRIRKLRFIPSISSATIIVLMIQIYSYASLDSGLSNYGLGYSFVYPSTFLFLFAVVLHLFSI